MLSEFLAKNIPCAKAIMLFDFLGRLNEQKILKNLGTEDNKIIQHVIRNSDLLIRLVTDSEGLGVSETQLLEFGDNIVMIRRIDQDKVLVLLLSNSIANDPTFVQFNSFAN